MSVMSNEINMFQTVHVSQVTDGLCCNSNKSVYSCDVGQINSQAKQLWDENNKSILCSQ